MLVYEFVDPLGDEKIEAKANQEGILTAEVNVRENDKITQQKAFMGAVVQLGEQSEVLPIIQSASGMEYSLTTAIKKLAVIEKPAVGFLQGHGEVSLQEMPHVVQNLSILYEVQPVFLTDSTQELNQFNTVAIIGPVDSLPQEHLDQLEVFLKRGGKLLVALNRVTADLNKTPYSNSITTGLETWLQNHGVQVQNNLVLDINCQVISYGVPRGPFTEVRQAMFPYVFAVQKFSEHVITGGLEQVLLQYASTVDFMGDSSLLFEPLLFTSEHSTTEAASTYFNIERDWQESDFPISNLVVGGSVEGPIAGGASTRMVVLGDADFPKSKQGNQVNPDNINLLVNAIDWLSDETGLVGLRTKGATARPLEELEEGKRKFLKILNFGLPILLVIVYGIYRFQSNRIIRLKRREEGYV
jgi:gliding-associated putative ABC transporter substrate-binding component GldG